MQLSVGAALLPVAAAVLVTPGRPWPSPALHQSRAPRLASGSPTFPPLPSQPPPERPSIATAVQRLASTDASRCWTSCRDELCGVDADSGLVRLHAGFGKATQWLKSRELIIRWAALNWAEHHIVPHLPSATLPVPVPPLRVPAKPTLVEALAPIGPWHLTRNAFRVSPGRTLKALARLLWLQVSRHVLPKEVALRRRRRALAPTLHELASAYAALR